MMAVERRRRHVTVVDNSALARRIGERLRMARTAAELTQQQLAGGRYTPAYISALERGLAKPSMASLAYLAPRLGCHITDLVGEQGEVLPTSASVIDDIVAERRRQDARWGDQSLIFGYPEGVALAILDEKVGAAARQVLACSLAVTVADKRDARKRLRVELIRVAAVAVAWLEGLDAREAADEGGR